jgi:hypothetical protein
VRILIAVIAVLWMPGVILSRLLGIRWHRPWNWAMPIGLSLSANAIGALWLRVAGFRVDGQSLLWIYTLLTVIAAVLVTSTSLRSLRVRHRTGNAQDRHPRPLIRASLLNRTLVCREHSLVSGKSLLYAGLLLVTVGTLILRFVQADGLVLPAWVDGLHHTYIVRALQVEGQIPRTLAGYGDVPFYYYFGFHVSAALFASLGGMTAAEAVLVLGQIINALIVMSVYSLAQRLTRRPSVALVAAALTGGISTMPAYYVAWSRATFTAGMFLLALTMAALWDVCQAQSWRRIACFMLLASGLFLSHYIILIYFCCFIPLALLCLRRRDSRSTRDGWGRPVWAVGIAGLGAVLIVAPWLWHINPHILPRTTIHVSQATMSQQVATLETRLGYLWYLVRQPGNLVVTAIAVAMAIVAVWRRRVTGVLVGWIALLLLLSQQLLWKLGPLRTDLVMISLFLPANILAAEGLYLVQNAVSRHANRFSVRIGPTISVLLLGLGLVASVFSVNIVRKDTVLATEADIKAMRWIGANIPPEGTFLINVTPWSPYLYRGTDGGWWLPLTTGHATVLPPGIYYGWNSSEYILTVKDVATRIAALDSCTDAFWQLARDLQITHIYVGTPEGPLRRVYWPACQGIHELYAVDGVRVYEIAAAGAVPSSSEPSHLMEP